MTDSHDDRRRTASETDAARNGSAPRAEVERDHDVSRAETGETSQQESAPGDNRDSDADGADAAVAVEDLDPRFREPIEPESPAAENALFVFLGVLGTVGLLASAVLPGLL
ncbi:DUF7312 domain-containing protein [Halobellus rarus]|uniref:DUF7312 domain-containing protein n=1 Tax=Halobellus rarus TaxID=1126237 RepID=A0ABD6CJW9_9EURY|nr:hypothetical protein [Halobellus rarus]